MYRKILAPLDGSKLGECTLEHVKEIAKGCNVPEVVFLAVVDAKVNYAASEIDEKQEVRAITQVEEAEKKSAQAYVSKITTAAKKDGLAAKSVVLEGNPADEILGYADKNGVDLIVMSTHGRSGVTRFAIGSVTDKVIRSASQPVLVVTPEECKVKV